MMKMMMMMIPAPLAPKAGGVPRPALPAAWEITPAGGGPTRVPGTRSGPTLLGGVSACAAAHKPLEIRPPCGGAPNPLPPKGAGRSREPLGKKTRA